MEEAKKNLYTAIDELRVVECQCDNSTTCTKGIAICQISQIISMLSEEK